jgi:hypothetical protein
MCDVEADGPCPGLYSMVEIGVVKVQEPLEDAPTFYAQMCPDQPLFMQEALDVFGATRDETLAYPPPVRAMLSLERWVKENNTNGRPQFISDNNGFDFQFVNYAMWRYVGRNVFGHSSTNLGSLYKGIKGDFFKSFKHLRDTKHTHNPVDDSRGNAEALIKMRDKFGMKLRL